MCRPGFHLVRGHSRVCKTGTKTWVDAHIAKNPLRNGIRILLSENLLYLYWTSAKRYKNLKPAKGFKAGEDFDAAIQFWLEYWTAEGLDFPKVDPLLIKCVVAIESGFDPRSQTKVSGSTAKGLMQITATSLSALEGTPNKDNIRELKNGFVRLIGDDVYDPVMNIAAGTRWLFHKYKLIPRGAKKDIFNTLKNYYGWTKDGDSYARKVIKLYEQSK